MSRLALSTLITLLSAGAILAQPSEPDWSALEDETLEHFRALPRFEDCFLFGRSWLRFTIGMHTMPARHRR